MWCVSFEGHLPAVCLTLQFIASKTQLKIGAVLEICEGDCVEEWWSWLCDKTRQKIRAVRGGARPIVFDGCDKPLIDYFVLTPLTSRSVLTASNGIGELFNCHSPCHGASAGAGWCSTALGSCGLLEASFCPQRCCGSVAKVHDPQFLIHTFREWHGVCIFVIEISLCVAAMPASNW